MSQTSETAVSPGKLVPRITTPDDAEKIRPFGLDMRVMMRTQDTGGAFSALYVVHEPGEGPPNHMHENQDEYVYVLQGTYEVCLGELVQNVSAGSMMFIPRNTVHRFKNIGTAAAHMLDWSIPGGQDKYFTEIEALAKAHGFGDEMMAKAQAVNQRYTTQYFK